MEAASAAEIPIWVIVLSLGAARRGPVSLLPPSGSSLPFTPRLAQCSLRSHFAQLVSLTLAVFPSFPCNTIPLGLLQLASIMTQIGSAPLE
ncbi:hypothetical protein BDV93DRAFT_566947 [Ceratobasidium sp. AG-I]|nr:hypothetical protein BDV93DRAFT_566947 [Ceratobasidium sp. AG-I]